MKTYALLCFAVALATTARADGDDHHTCACEAEELGFKIDCSNQDAMLAALAVLQDDDNKCKEDCESEVCRKNFLIIQSHHDYCLHDEVPEPLEDALHLFEENCEECDIVSKPDLTLPDCPIPSCDDTSGDEAYQNLLESGCLSSCEGDVCASNFRMLVAVHDSCPEDTLDPLSELGLHDFEDPCEVHNCIADRDDQTLANQLVCLDDGSGDPAFTRLAALWLPTVVFAVVALVA